MKNSFRKYFYTFFLAFIAVLGSCSTNDLDPSLEQNKEGSEALKTSADIEGIIKGAYNRMTSFEYYGRDYIVTNEVRTPNTWANGRSGRFTTESGFAYNANSLYIWDNAYAVIASANIVIGANIENLDDVTTGGAYARHLQGQAYAMRALAHFDLLKTFGQKHVGGNLGIPYITEFKGDNEIPARATVAENEASILQDIKTAFDLMSEDFNDPSREFISKYTAKALESRFAIWFEMWTVARDAAKAVFDANIYSIVPANQYVASFAIDSPVNSLFELAFDDTDNEGINGLEYIYRGPTYGDISVAPNAYDNLYGEGDVRADILGTETVGSNERLRNIGKYPERSSNVTIIRYEEVILNYAEALFELGETQTALIWLNMIPENRNAEQYSEVTKENILEERRKEFIFEGHYYWDLQRMGYDIVEVDTEQNINETIPYGDPRRIHPIPNAELDANSNMEQNPGY